MPINLKCCRNCEYYEQRNFAFQCKSCGELFINFKQTSKSYPLVDGVGLLEKTNKQNYTNKCGKNISCSDCFVKVCFYKMK